MSRIPVALRTALDSATAATLDAVKAKLGMVPNMFATLANAPAALNGYLTFSDALAKGALSPRQREAIALAVAQANTCGYCLSAHTMLGKGAGLQEADITAARQGRSFDPVEAAIVALAVAVTKRQGRVSDEDIATARRAGVEDALIIEVVANVALNILTNYTNHVAGTDIDFPVVTP